MRELILRLLRLAVAVAAVAAMVGQIAHSVDTPDFSYGNFFSYFTIESNILGVLVWLVLVMYVGRQRSVSLEAVRGAATLFLAITGVVVALILRKTEENLDLTLGWVDFILHDLTPLAMVLDWLVDPPQHRLPRRVAVAWLAYPLVYAIYTLIRGSSTHWYPYPFLNADKHGVGGVIERGIPLLIGMLVLGLVVREVGELRRRRVAAAAG